MVIFQSYVSLPEGNAKKKCTTYLESHEFSFPIQHFSCAHRPQTNPTTRRVAIELAKEVRPHHADGGEHANPPSVQRF